MEYKEEILEKCLPKYLEDDLKNYKEGLKNKSTLIEQIGEKYGKGDIVNLFKAFLFNTNGKQADMPGVICSEYIATSNQDIQSFFGLKPWCITPAHFKKYFMLQGVPSIE